LAIFRPVLGKRVAILLPTLATLATLVPCGACFTAHYAGLAAPAATRGGNSVKHLLELKM
jgi:hypothetical protein